MNLRDSPFCKEYDVPARLPVGLLKDLPAQVATDSEKTYGSAGSHTSSLLMSLGNNLLAW